MFVVVTVKAGAEQVHFVLLAPGVRPRCFLEAAGAILDPDFFVVVRLGGVRVGGGGGSAHGAEAPREDSRLISIFVPLFLYFPYIFLYFS